MNRYRQSGLPIFLGVYAAVLAGPSSALAEREVVVKPVASVITGTLEPLVIAIDTHVVFKRTEAVTGLHLNGAAIVARKEPGRPFFVRSGADTFHFVVVTPGKKSQTLQVPIPALQETKLTSTHLFLKVSGSDKPVFIDGIRVPRFDGALAFRLPRGAEWLNASHVIEIGGSREEPGRIYNLSFATPARKLAIAAPASDPSAGSLFLTPRIQLLRVDVTDRASGASGSVGSSLNPGLGLLYRPSRWTEIAPFLFGELDRVSLHEVDTRNLINPTFARGEVGAGLSFKPLASPRWHLALAAGYGSEFFFRAVSPTDLAVELVGLVKFHASVSYALYQTDSFSFVTEAGGSTFLSKQTPTQSVRNGLESYLKLSGFTPWPFGAGGLHPTLLEIGFKASQNRWNSSLVAESVGAYWLNLGVVW